MESVVTLLAHATVLCKTKRALAQRMGCSEQTIQALIKGRRHLTPGQAIALANLLGLNPIEVAAQDLIEREPDPVERGRLQEGFFRRGIAGGVAMLLIFGDAATNEAHADGLSGDRQSCQFIHCRAFLRALFRRALEVLTATLSTEDTGPRSGPREHPFLSTAS